MIEPIPAGVRIRVRVQPRASRTELAGRMGDVLKVRVAAPPVEGAANQALVRLLADRLNVPRSAIEVTTGAGSRSKVVTVLGIGVEAASGLLGL